jgi:hypothetical protein
MRVSVFQIGHPIRTLIILVQDKNTSLKLPVGVSPLQLVFRQFKEKNKNLWRLRLKSVLKIEQISVVL